MMKVLHTIADLQNELQQARLQGKEIGLVPTMGALHLGHLSLVKQSVQENGFTVVSVFVNPTQFNNADDLRTYPRTLEADTALLQEAACDLVFAPTVEEMYPQADTRQFDFGLLDKVMEGAHRPGHFNGVAQIVSKLFAAVQADRAYFGEKDFQQLAIIKDMVKQLQLPIEIVACPIVREASGLALSSRNTRLSPIGKEKAVHISKTLLRSLALKDAKTPAELKQWIEQELAAEPYLQVEYVELVDALSLQAINQWLPDAAAVACVAVFCEGVRLIDNVIYS